MTRVSPAEIIDRQGFVVAVNVITLEQAEAYLMAAEASGSAIMLQLSENTVKFHGSLKPMALALIELAEQTGAGVAVHLDHATDQALVRSAIELGFDSVMFDGASLSFDSNLELSRELAMIAKNRGIWFEAELGEVGGKDGNHGHTGRTDPMLAARFASESGISALAVAVGSSHAMRSKSAALDLALITEIAGLTRLPLVLHGSSGVALPVIAEAIRSGIKKVNLATELNLVHHRALSVNLDAGAADPRKYLIPARRAVANHLDEYLRNLTAAVMEGK